MSRSRASSLIDVFWLLAAERDNGAAPQPPVPIVLCLKLAYVTRKYHRS